MRLVDLDPACRGWSQAAGDCKRCNDAKAASGLRPLQAGQELSGPKRTAYERACSRPLRRRFATDIRRGAVTLIVLLFTSILSPWAGYLSASLPAWWPLFASAIDLTIAQLLSSPYCRGL
jgi:hypothetical protein